jgi:neutral trehalase
LLAGVLDKAAKLRTAAMERWAGIDALLWHELQGEWCDHDLTASLHLVPCNFYVSNVFPLLMLAPSPGPPQYWSHRQRRVVQYLVVRDGD